MAITGADLLAVGWTKEQVKQYYPGLFTFNGGAVPTAVIPPPSLPTGTPVSSVITPAWLPTAKVVNGGVSIMPTPEPESFDFPLPLTGMLAAGTAAIGIPAVGVALGAGMGVAQAVGVQFPWETGPGEGFIAPWNRNIVRDEQGLWVTPETRPDLFGAASKQTALEPAVGAGIGAGVGAQVVKTWTANGWPFAMTADGKIHTVTKTGIRKSWRPYKSIVLGKKMNQSMALRAVKKLQGIKKLATAIEKLGGTRTVYRSK